MKLTVDTGLYLRHVLALVAMFAGAMPLQAGAAEPESQGHPLSYWLEHYVAAGGAQERAIPEAAIREIGTNGLPAMVVWVWYEPSRSATEIPRFLSRTRTSANGRWVPQELAPGQTVPRGDIGFHILGPAGAPAIPELAQIANDAGNPRPAARAMMALSCIGPAALPVVEARLANKDFPFPPEAALNLYLKTRLSADYEHRLSPADIRPVLVELQTNRNPLLAQGATRLLDTLALPSMNERGQTKSIPEAMLDLRTERQMGTHLKPGWNIHPRDRLTSEERLAASNVVYSAMTSPPAQPKGDEPYPYPLYPGTAAWDYADVQERLKSVVIPKSWREHATSWQLFRSAIGNPYFRTMGIPGEDIGRGYEASRSDIISILKEVDTAPDFGSNVLRWLSELDVAKIAGSRCADFKPYEPCYSDYEIVWHMAGLDSALKTLDVASRQRLYRLAVWDADYFLSRSDNATAVGPIAFIYAFSAKPESFRGTLPPDAILHASGPSVSGLTAAEGFMSDPAKSRTAIAAAKTALGLVERP